MIIGTAGHIDHGKTTLVRALTGVDTDRLPEEKRRGITIELGFAPLVLDGIGTVGVVDVPGHEAFVRTMLAGAAGIDVGLLVVAADDGVRPQTREHLAILELLDVRGGVVALTKCDLADADWIDLVEEDLRASARGTAFERAPVVRVQPGDDAALTALRSALADAVRAAAPRDPDDLFRLPVDRVFSVRGTGTVVTGTAWSGSLARDAEVRILPAGRVARVRGIQNHGVPGDRAYPGQRTAIALAGVDVADLHRGDVLVADAAWEPTLALRADATLLAVAPRSLGPRTAVRFHLGTTEVGARVVSAAGALAPGETRPVRLVLDAPVVARGGDRFVLRTASPLATIGGGVVTDAQAPRRGKPFDAAKVDVAARLRWLLREAGPRGVPAGSLRVRLGGGAGDIERAIASAAAVSAPRSERLVASHAVDADGRRLLGFLDAYHLAHPLAPGASLQELRTRLLVPAEFVELLVRRGAEAGEIETEGGEVRRRGWRPSLAPAQQVTLTNIVSRLAVQGWEPASVEELTVEFGPGTEEMLRIAAGQQLVVQVEANRYYATAPLNQILDKVSAAFAGGRDIAPSELRQTLGLSRKYVIPLLEYCDRSGLTMRRGEGRVWIGREPGA